jgi:hypothetical protein
VPGRAVAARTLPSLRLERRDPLGPALGRKAAQLASQLGAARAPGGHRARDPRGGTAVGVQPWDKVRGHRWG